MLKGRLNTVDLLAITIISVPFYAKNIICLFYKTAYLGKEVNCTESSLHLVLPVTRLCKGGISYSNVQCCTQHNSAIMMCRYTESRMLSVVGPNICELAWSLHE